MQLPLRIGRLSWMYVIECLQTKPTPKKPSRPSEENSSALLPAPRFTMAQVSKFKVWGTCWPAFGCAGMLLPISFNLLLTLIQLWAIIFQNRSDFFFSQSMNRKFYDAIEELLVNPKTSPVVRERLIEVLGAIVYNSSSGTCPSTAQHWMIMILI